MSSPACICTAHMRIKQACCKELVNYYAFGHTYLWRPLERQNQTMKSRMRGEFERFIHPFVTCRLTRYSWVLTDKVTTTKSSTNHRAQEEVFLSLEALRQMMLWKIGIAFLLSSAISDPAVLSCSFLCCSAMKSSTEVVLCMFAGHWKSWAGHQFSCWETR